MALIGFPYLVLLLVAVPAYWLVIPSRWRGPFLAALSLGFIASHGAVWAGQVAALVAAVYLCAQALRRMSPGAGRRALVWAALAALTANLVLRKFSPGASPSTLVSAPLAAIPLGLSYVTFRLIHHVVESYRGRAPESSFAGFLSYSLFFPTFLAGPVERFERFQAQAESVRPDFQDINRGLARIALGILKKAFIADSLAGLTLPILRSPADSAPVMVWLGVYALAVQVYMDFSGYTDIAIGSARLFGYRIVENFDRPFLQPNIARFWRSWHISVSSFIRDYFFLPLFGYRASALKLYSGLVVSMVVFHLWHGLSSNYLLLGLCHGLGLAVWQLFQGVQKGHAGLKRFMDGRFAGGASILATFTFVSLSMVLLVFDTRQAFAVYRHLALIFR
jgi:alginate O-acetyltransferase complex protein AlgI